MIKQLKLKNYILIDELCANFDKGLNVITGETGAGKSILLNAIDLVFSNRVSKDVIKTGCDKALIEIILENHHDVSEIFEQNGIDDCGEEITISKEITQNSVRSRINGTMVNQELLKRLRTLFVDIHSQHQTYTFLQPQYHITLLDAYAKDFYGETLAKYKKLYKEYSNLQKQLSEAQGTANAAQSQIDFLKFEINEIEDAQITSANEDTELENELEVLNNAEKLKELTGSAYWTINGDDESIIETLSKINNDFIAVNESLRDIASYLRDYSQNLNSDEQRLNDIQERLFVLDKLKRKYGGSLEAVQKTYNDASEELSKIEFSTKNIEELTSKINTLKDELMQLAQLISKSRSDYAKVLSVLIQDKLEVLELPKSRFELRQKMTFCLTALIMSNL